MKPFLVGQNFWCFIDGSNPQPPEYLPSTEGQPLVKNPEFKPWERTDRSLVSIITSTLSEPILAMVVGCNTAHETWECLACHYA